VRDTLLACELAAPQELVIAYAPKESQEYFRALASRASLVPQVDGDLGARVEAAFASVFGRGATRAVAIGTDTPHLKPERIVRALDALADTDCVIGPASDGGYYLIALSQPHPELFRDVEWSTPRVLEQTLARAHSAGLRVELLEEMHDVDQADDVTRLAAELRKNPAMCRYTAHVLAEVLGE
jgi:rSAM/selenodomain-associated transferase 1